VAGTRPMRPSGLEAGTKGMLCCSEGSPTGLAWNMSLLCLQNQRLSLPRPSGPLLSARSPSSPAYLEQSPVYAWRTERNSQLQPASPWGALSLRGQGRDLLEKSVRKRLSLNTDIRTTSPGCEISDKTGLGTLERSEEDEWGRAEPLT
jgi:hypothetical protein